MIRNFKTLGLALVAMFALSAVVASAASAQNPEQGVLTSDGPVTLIGEETGPAGSNVLTAFGFKTECPGSTYTGHKHLETPHKPIPNGARDVTLTPHYKQAPHNCKSVVGGLNLPTTIDMNGCDYDLHIGKTTPAGNKEHTYGAKIDVTCPAGKEITVTVWTNTTQETEGITPMCVLHVKEQLGLTGAHVKDTTNGTLDINGTVVGIHVLKTKTTHGLLCPEATTATGEFDIDATVKGLNEAGGATAISISEVLS